MFTWAKLALAVVGIWQSIMDRFKEKRFKDAGAAEQREATRKENQEVRHVGESAFDDAGDAFDAAEGVPNDDDPNLRD